MKDKHVLGSTHKSVFFKKQLLHLIRFYSDTPFLFKCLKCMCYDIQLHSTQVRKANMLILEKPPNWSGQFSIFCVKSDPDTKPIENWGRKSLDY